MDKDADYWISTLNLVEHPEGGYFRETYRAKELIQKNALSHRYTGDRALSTAIYFLLKSGQVSRLHKLTSDELWHFYTGSSLTIHIIDQKGHYTRICLGPNPEKQQVFQAVIPADCWFGATVDLPNSYSLIGCTVAPGFDFNDFKLGKREDLLRQFPGLADIIQQLT